MQKGILTKDKHCSTTGELCVRGIAVFDRTITVRRWTGGSIKASLCTLECAEQWAESRGYIATGVSEKRDGIKEGVHEAIVIVQHPDQVPTNILEMKKKRSKQPPHP